MNFLVIRKSGFWVIFVMLTAMQLSAQVKLSIDLNNTGARISPVHYGVFFEDINLAADGGLYAELIKNRSFEDYESTDPWIITNYSGAVSSMSVDTANLLNSAQRKALKLAISSLPYENSLTRLINKGYWGLKINKNETYKVSFFARCDTSFKGDISVSLENIYSQQYAKTIITGISQEWKKFSVSPNPASGQITFRFDSHESYPVQVQNSLGIVILNCMAKDGSIIDCSKWNPGMYLIHSENLGTHKIIVC
jgi:hypothetical protein